LEKKTTDVKVCCFFVHSGVAGFNLRAVKDDIIAWDSRAG